MNEYTRFVRQADARPRQRDRRRQRRAAGGRAIPFGVNLGRGYPRFNPGEYTTSDTLARGEADAALIVACDPMAQLQPAGPRAPGAHPVHRARPQGDADDRARPRWRSRRRRTASTSRGTVYRMDDVPIPLRPAVRFAVPQRRGRAESDREADSRVARGGRSGQWISFVTELVARLNVSEDMKVVIGLSARGELKALPILLRHSPGMVLPTDLHPERGSHWGIWSGKFGLRNFAGRAKRFNLEGAN